VLFSVNAHFDLRPPSKVALGTVVGRDDSRS